MMVTLQINTAVRGGVGWGGGGAGGRDGVVGGKAGQRMQPRKLHCYIEF